MDQFRHILLIGLFGALGAMSRHGVNLLVNRWAGDAFPLGTFVVNMVGCFLLGLLWGLATARPETSHTLPPGVREAVTIGFLGALTTFSTFGLDTLKCLHREAYFLAGLNVVASVAVGLLAVQAGVSLARFLVVASSQ